jgi:ABC-type multidrug transport system fused ATPase/permease subunit
LVSVVASMGRVMELQKLEEEVKGDENIQSDRIGVKITDVSFGYNEELVLEAANVDIKPGEFVALVGESGIGKTTLIRLVMAFAKCNKGLIEFYDDNEIREEINAAVREFISYVPQGNTLFSGTIKENVKYGNRDATDDEVVKALKKACAYDFVMELPDEMDTVIGEKGLGISEGQAQRIAIARALIKGTPFLILDEATSALDEKTELKVLEEIRKIVPTPTCLLITHRRSVLNYCDRQIRISDKKIEELI